MKKFFVFAGVMISLIASEYYLLTEIFANRRLPVIAGGFLAVACCLFILLRFFRASVTSFTH